MSKQKIEELAIFGAPSFFSENLYVGRPNIGNRESLLFRINDMLDRRWLTNNGPFVEELEKKLAAFLGVRHCIAMCNATVALEVTARALGLHGEVIIPSFTFVATAHALQWQAITPVFCDVDPLTHNIDPSKIENLITPRTTGILGVHVWGRVCDIDALRSIAQKHHLKLMFDAAHAFACSHHGQMIGGFGNAEVFSFHATKFFNSFEGGAVTTNDDTLAQKIREMRNFGFAGLDTVINVGTNGKMSEVSAAMALTSLESLDEFIAVNKKNYLEYQKGLLGIPGINMIAYDFAEKNNFQYIVIEVDENVTNNINRDLLVKILHAENVLARRYFYPGCHQMEPYRALYPQTDLSLFETEKLVLRVIQLPTGTNVGKQEIADICELIRFIVNNGREISKRYNRPLV
ncbi:MAG: aminotransferase class I/II-fold pyridoxal phosphate-dependent enzyme [Anaerolineales bacterium]|nr:aminotransferase class I/II-fold pyridoxal phosphate-dependent enzyme [Anaerolineales bacterium]